METNETTFNESEALKLIEQTITNTKQRFKDDGFLLIMWGWIVILGNIINYVALEQSQELLFMYWPIACIIGGVASGIIGAKKRSAEKVTSFSGQAMSYVWGGCGIAAVILWFAAVSFGWEYINCAMFVAFAVPVFITGGMMKFKPAIFGGLVLFAFGVGIFFIAKEPYANLIAAGGWALGYLIPGYLLKKDYKESNV